MAPYAPPIRPFLAARLVLLAVAAWSAVACHPAVAAETIGGEVTWKRFTVRSPATGKIERFWIGHTTRLKADGQYPVIYFLPGLLDNENHWKKALDPHLARHEVMAVCPSVGGGTWFMNSPAQKWMRWGDFLTQELRAFVETHYPASREKGQRGIVGISAGAHAALYHALGTDLYGSVSLISGAMDLRGYAGAAGLDWWIGPRTPETLPLYQEHSAMVRLERHAGPLPFELYLDVGDKDGTKPQMEALRRILESRNIPHRWHVGQGGHNWTYWQSRVADHLEWHMEQFAQNQRDQRYTQIAPVPAEPALEPVGRLPDVALSDEALARLRAAWSEGPTGEPLRASGIPPEGAPLSKQDEKYRQVILTAPLTARGHAPGLYLYRLTLAVSTPLEESGTVTVESAIRTGANQSVLSISPAALPIPAGEPKRRVELRARLAVELKAPDPLRGGIVGALQIFDAEGAPVGEPIVGQDQPGTAAIERWPIAPAAQAQWTLSLSGPEALRLAEILEAHLVAEAIPEAPQGAADANQP